MNANSPIEVRDLRQQDWIWTSKQILFHKDINGNTYKVYCGLASYANNDTQQAYPSVNTLSSKLHIARNTVMRAITVLESCGFIHIDKTKGEHNVYSLLEVSGVQRKKDIPTLETPRSDAERFFDGVACLRMKKETTESETVRAMLKAFSQNYPQASKEAVWKEVKAFEQYWTESTLNGSKQRWETEKTFDISRRLARWFMNKKEFAVELKGKKQNRIV